MSSDIVCSENLREVEEEGLTLEITRHGKVIAIAASPEKPSEPGKTYPAMLFA